MAIAPRWWREAGRGARQRLGGFGRDGRLRNGAPTAFTDQPITSSGVAVIDLAIRLVATTTDAGLKLRDCV